MQILCQVFLIILLSIIIKDLIKLKRYKWWCIPIFLYVTYCEYYGFYIYLGTPSKNTSIIFLTSIILLQLGATGFLLIKNCKNIEY